MEIIILGYVSHSAIKPRSNQDNATRWTEYGSSWLNIMQWQKGYNLRFVRNGYERSYKIINPTKTQGTFCEKFENTKDC